MSRGRMTRCRGVLCSDADVNLDALPRETDWRRASRLPRNLRDASNGFVHRGVPALSGGRDDGRKLAKGARQPAKRERASCEPVFPRMRKPRTARTESAMLTSAASAATSAEVRFTGGLCARPPELALRENELALEADRP
jgi:hypothetical protein